MTQMDIAVENLLIQFLRTQCAPFSVRDVASGLSAIGFQAAEVDLVAFLNSCPLVFGLQNGNYLTKAGAFTDALFSIKPSRMEIQGGFLLAGHRCVPFVDSEQPSGTITFMYKNKILSHRVLDFPMHDVLPFFNLFGEEYAVQYIMSDPAAVQSVLPCVDDEIPQRVKLSVVDLSSLYNEVDFQPGDTLLATVANWDKSVVALQPMQDKKATPFEQLPLDKKRTKWYSLLEKALLESFVMYGPGFSIEDQLAKVFFTFYCDLCVPSCGTIEQFVRQSKKVGVEPYGVETRLWFKGEDVPAIGEWMAPGGKGEAPDSLYGTIPGSPASFPVLQSVLDSWLLDQFHNKQESDDFVLEQLFPDNYEFKTQELKQLQKEIACRRELLRKTYNWFADFDVAKIRHEVLGLYRRISSLVYELDSVPLDLQFLPQQPLVILTQLLNHSRFMLESMLDGDGLKTDDLANFHASLEGMEFNFEEVSAELTAALLAQRKKHFSVVKDNGHL